MDEPKLYPDARVGEVYLGSYMGHDLYWDGQHGIFPTVIARFGPGDNDYKSGLMLSESDEYLGEAKRRAEGRGLSVDVTGDSSIITDTMMVVDGELQIGVATGASGRIAITLMMKPAGAESAVEVPWLALQFATPDEVMKFISDLYVVAVGAFGLEDIGKARKKLLSEGQRLGNGI